MLIVFPLRTLRHCIKLYWYCLSTRLQAQNSKEIVFLWKTIRCCFFFETLFPFRRPGLLLQLVPIWLTKFQEESHVSSSLRSPVCTAKMAQKSPHIRRRIQLHWTKRRECEIPTIKWTQVSVDQSVCLGFIEYLFTNTRLQEQLSCFEK